MLPTYSLKFVFFLATVIITTGKNCTSQQISSIEQYVHVQKLDWSYLWFYQKVAAIAPQRES